MNLLDWEMRRLRGFLDKKMKNMPTPAYAPKQNAYIQPFTG